MNKNNMKIDIRQATENDYAAIRQLMIQSLQYHINLHPDVYEIKSDFFSKELYIQLLEQRTVLVAVCGNGNIAGAISYTINTAESRIQSGCKSLWIADFIVDEKYRRQGIGNRMFEEVKCIAKDNGVDKIELSVDASNHNAISLYEKHGLRASKIKMELPV